MVLLPALVPKLKVGPEVETGTESYPEPEPKSSPAVTRTVAGEPPLILLTVGAAATGYAVVETARASVVTNVLLSWTVGNR